MSKNKVIAICLFVFQALLLIGLAVIGTIGIAIAGLIFCSFGVTAGLLLCLDTKEQNKSVASGVLLVLFALFLVIGSIGAMVNEFNGWYIVFLIGAIAMGCVGGWILYRRYTQSTKDNDSGFSKPCPNCEEKVNETTLTSENPSSTTANSNLPSHSSPAFIGIGLLGAGFIVGGALLDDLIGRIILLICGAVLFVTAIVLAVRKANKNTNVKDD